MKIVIATDNYYPNVNGASYFGQRLARSLQDRKHEILVIAPALSVKSEYFTHKGVRVFGVRSMPLIKKIKFRHAMFFSQYPVWQTLEKFRPDVIHLQGHFSISRYVAHYAWQHHIPMVGTNHFMPENLVHYFHLGSTIENNIKKLAWKYFISTFAHLDAVTTPTHSAAQLLRDIGFNKKIHVISNGIDLQQFSPKQDDEKLRAKYHIPPGPILLYTGRIDKEKNLEVVIRALAKLPANVLVHFVAIGCGTHQIELEKLTQELKVSGKVTFTGFVPDDDFPYLLAIADCFISPGIAELQSISTMEAMANGLPILAANAVALPELVHPGVNGFLFEPNDDLTLARYITDIFTNHNLCRQLGEGSTQIIQEHDIHQVIKQFEELYLSVKNSPPAD